MERAFVLVADVVRSRSFGADARRAVQRRVRAITEAGAAFPYEQDGLGFHRAREAYGQVRGAGERARWSHEAPFRPAGSSRRWTALSDGRRDPVRDALLLHMDGLLERWTRPQRQAIALVLEGRRYEDAGAALGVSAQAIFRRLRAADLERYLAGHEALKAVWS